MQHFLKSRTAESVLRIEVREEAITSIAVIAGVMEQATNFWSGRKLLDFFFGRQAFAWWVHNILHQMVWMAMVSYTELYRRFFHCHCMAGAGFSQQFLCQPKLQDFVQYYDSIMPMLKQFVMTATSKKEKRAIAVGVPTPLTSQLSTCCGLTWFFVWYVNQGMDIWYFRIHSFNRSTEIPSPRSSDVAGESFARQILWMHVSAGRPRFQGKSVKLHYILCLYKDIYCISQYIISQWFVGG